jgi:hypothetical protein
MRAEFPTANHDDGAKTQTRRPRVILLVTANSSAKAARGRGFVMAQAVITF